MQHVDNVLL